MPERIDRRGEHKTALKKNKQIVLATQDVCGICGAPVDKTLKAPDPLSPTVDHIIPVAKGGHPSDLQNLQLAHRWCNLHKSDRLFAPGPEIRPGNKSPGLKNNRGVKNNPPPVYPGEQFDRPGKEQDPDVFNGDCIGQPGQISSGDMNSPHADHTAGNKDGGAGITGQPDNNGHMNTVSADRDAVNNDDLPLHADWTTLVW